MTILRAVVIAVLAYGVLSAPFRMDWDKEKIYVLAAVVAVFLLPMLAIWFFGKKQEPPLPYRVEPPPIDPRLRKADEDSAALEEAVRYGYKAIAEKLVAAGADVNREHMGTTPLREAILHGQGSIARFLIEHGADPRALNHFFDPNAESLVTKLFHDGDAALAQEVGKAVTGVHIPQPDGELLAKGQTLGSLFLALAARFKHEGDLASAGQLYEWKIEQWKADPFEDAPCPSAEQMSRCLRTVAEIKEVQGNLPEALRLCRKALQILAWNLRRPTDYDDEGFALTILDEPDRQALFTDTWLQYALSAVSGADRPELVAVLRHCERLLRQVDPAEVEEQIGAPDRVAAALQRLDGPQRR